MAKATPQMLAKTLIDDILKLKRTIVTGATLGTFTGGLALCSLYYGFPKITLVILATFAAISFIVAIIARKAYQKKERQLKSVSRQISNNAKK